MKIKFLYESQKVCDKSVVKFILINQIFLKETIKKACNPLCIYKKPNYTFNHHSNSFSVAWKRKFA